MAKVNGKEISAEGLSVSEFLQREGYSKDRVAVEINLKIIKKEAWDKTKIAEGDTVEILSFVGGG